MIQPPGCSGVQALIYNKLLPYLEDSGWEFHFAGPAPHLFSVLTETLQYPRERLHYTNNVSFSHRFSIKKNRCSKNSPPFIFFGLLQFLFRAIERLTGHNSDAYLLRGLENVVQQAEREWNFDLIAGKSPEFKVLQLVSQLTWSMNKPFLAMVVDPYGARDESGFYPKTPEIQRKILNQSCATVFMSPLTMERYIKAGLVDQDKAKFFTDSYPEMPELYQANRSLLARNKSNLTSAKRKLTMVYLGMLPEWRPIEPLLDALGDGENQTDSSSPFLISIFGYVYPAAKQRISTSAKLSQMIHIYPIVSYAQSHFLAEDADIQLVVIGPRHIDNFPSKFFEYLAHQKPVLVLGPLQNPLKSIMDSLEIGLYVDSKDSQAIGEALRSLQSNYMKFKNAYHHHAKAIETFSAHQVAENFCRILDQAMINASEN
jgi:hypothetical protein